MTEDPRRGWTSASNAQADLYCPARHRMNQGKLSVATSDAILGQRIHSALAKRSPEGLSVEEHDTYDACCHIEARKVKEFYGFSDVPKDLRSWPEERYWITFQFQQPEAPATQRNRQVLHSAQPDRVYRFGPRILIIEYKTLTGDIAESPRNLQARDQAVVCAGHFLADEVGVCVIQPFHTHNPEICLYGKADLERAKQELFSRVLASNDPRSVRVPGEVQCKFCLGKPDCVEHQRWAGSMVPNMLNLLDVPVSAWTPEQRALFCDRYSIAYKWLNDCWDAIEAGAEKDPKYVPGYAFVPGVEKREIIDPQGVFAEYCKKGGTAEQFLTATKVGLTKLKELLSALSSPPLRGKKLDEAFNELTRGKIEFKRNKSTLKKVNGQ